MGVEQKRARKNSEIVFESLVCSALVEIQFSVVKPIASRTEFGIRPESSNLFHLQLPSQEKIPLFSSLRTSGWMRDGARPSYLCFYPFLASPLSQARTRIVVLPCHPPCPMLSVVLNLMLALVLRRQQCSVPGAYGKQFRRAQGKRVQKVRPGGILS